MKLIAIVRPPPRPEEAPAALARATGLTLAECRTRLAPEPPALLARLEEAAADALVAALRSAGLAPVAIDARVPTDASRTLAQRVDLSPRGVTFTPRAGEPLALGWDGILAVLRGSREARTEIERTETKKALSVGMALATGGLKVTRTASRTSVSSESSIQQVILVHGRDGRTAALVEGLVDFSCLGAELQPSSTANMATLARRLRDGAPGAFHDDRLLRLGRRPLPLIVGGESRAAAGGTVVTTRDTASTLDVLAELLLQAVAQGLLP
jgi:hypothetical protein